MQNALNYRRQHLYKLSFLEHVRYSQSMPPSNVTSKPKRGFKQPKQNPSPLHVIIIIFLFGLNKRFQVVSVVRSFAI